MNTRRLFLSDYFESENVQSPHFVREMVWPLIPAGSGQWSNDFIAASSVVARDGGLWLYAEGSANNHEQIGLFTCPTGNILDGWKAEEENPIVQISSTGYSAGGVFDPSICYYQDRWLLYFSATETDAHAFAEGLAHGAEREQPVGESIGMATSTDGVNFAKRAQPVMEGRCPFAIVWDNKIYLFHVRVKGGGYRVHLSVSDNGIDFSPVSPSPVLDVGPAGAWDSQSVTTPKVLHDGKRFWMFYAGDDVGFDDLRGIGAAWSHDLIHWTKSEKNPVFGAGEDGAFDSCSVQSPLVIPIGDRFAMFYAGSDRTVGDGLHSQIGLAWLA